MELNINKIAPTYKPTVSNNYRSINKIITLFGEGDFSKNFYDPAGGTYSKVTITSLPYLPLTLGGDVVVIGTEFSAVNSQNLRLELSDSFAIHNGVLYEFTKSIDDIIADYNALGKKLLSNTNGILLFIDPDNLSDTTFIQGVGIKETDLLIGFNVSSSLTNIKTIDHLFSLLPWENVNIKTNYILMVPGSDLQNPVIAFEVTTVGTTRTSTIRLFDNTELSDSWEVEAAVPVVLTDFNAAPNRNRIFKVNAVDVFETLTAMVQPTITGTTVTWKYRNELNVIQELSLDLLPLLPDVTDINIYSVEWDVDRPNILLIIESDLTTHEADFERFLLTAVLNANGTITLSQDATEILTISKVGTTNNYYDLDGLPSLADIQGLPKGIKDQLYFITEEGTNKVLPDWLMARATVVQSQEEWDFATANGIDIKNIFDSWEMFSHYSGSHAGGGIGAYSPPNFPALNPDDGASVSLTAEAFYNRSAWSYDEVNSQIFLSANYHAYTGLISPREYANYTLEATMSSANTDDDFIALVIAFWTDPTTGYQHTISIVRAMIEISAQGNWTYQLIYNFTQTTQKLLFDGTNLAPLPGGAVNGWSANGPTRVRVIRTADTFSIKCSQFGSLLIDDTTEITLDLNSDPLLEGAKVISKVGFAARSQTSAAFSDIEFTGLTDYIFWNKADDTYDTYEWNSDTLVFDLQNPKTTFAKDYIGRNRFIHSYLFDKVFHVDRNDKLICIKGDEGISWDPFNALSIGTDNRPYLSSLLFGTVENKKLYYYLKHNQNLDFTVYASWRINGNTYGIPTPISQSITLSPADGVYGRYDMFVLNADGTITAIEGTPSANPQEPVVADSASQLEGSFVFIPDNATVPDGFDTITIYDENAQEVGGEWDADSATPDNPRIVLDSATLPSKGTVSIEGTLNEQYDALSFRTGTPIAVDSVDAISYSLKNKAIVKKGYVFRIFIFGLDANGILKSYPLEIDPIYDRNNITTYQELSAIVPSTGLPFLTFHYIKFVILANDNEGYGFLLDDISLVQGNGQPIIQNFVTAEYVRSEDEKYLQLAKDYAEPLNVPPIADNKVAVYNLDGSKRYEDYGGGASSLLKKTKTYTSGAQTITADFDIVQVSSLVVGNSFLQEGTQYTVSGAVVTILDTLTSGAVIQLKYWKANAVNATNYTKAESDGLLANKLNKTTEIQAFVSLTQADYDLIGTKSPTTMYFIE